MSRAVVRDWATDEQGHRLNFGWLLISPRQSLFVHSRNVVGAVRLVAGDVCEYEIGVDERGRPEAINVRRITVGREPA